MSGSDLRIRTLCIFLYQSQISRQCIQLKHRLHFAEAVQFDPHEIINMNIYPDFLYMHPQVGTHKVNMMRKSITTMQLISPGKKGKSISKQSMNTI